ncbi:MAG: alpha/beta hydrolase [Planctomycetota bacterium]
MDIEFVSDGLRHSGTLVLPAAEGPHPCVLLAPGRGCYTREGRLPLAEVFAEAGLAAIAMDMRGMGESEGECGTAVFEDLVRDARAALAWASTHPAVDPKRLGVRGSSAGAWTAQALAEGPVGAAGERLAFVVTWIGPATSIEQQQRESGAQYAEDLGLEPESAALVQRHIDIAIDGSLTDSEAFEAFQAVRAVAKSEGWFGSMFAADDFPDTAADVGSIFLRRFRFDPKASLESLNDTPYLAVFGEDDSIVPVGSNTAKLRRALAVAGNENASIVVLPGVGHEVTDAFVEITIGFLRERGLMAE